MSHPNKLKILYIFTSGTIESANNKKWFRLFHKNPNCDVYYLIQDCNKEEKDRYFNFFGNDSNILFFKTLEDLKPKSIFKKYSYFKLIANKIDTINPNIIHIHGLFYSYMVMPLFFVKSKPKIIYNIWGSDFNISYFTNLKKKIIISWLIRKASLVWVNWYAMADNVKKIFPKYISKIKTIPWGVDKDLFHHASPEIKESVIKKFSINTKIPLMVYMRGFVENSNHIFLIDALKEIDSDFRIILHYGSPDTEYTDFLKQKIKTYGLESKITVSNQKLSYDEIKALYELSEITFSLTKNEQFSRTISEAILSNTHLIVSDIAPYRYLKEMFAFNVKLVSLSDNQTLIKTIKDTLNEGDPDWVYEKQVIKKIFNFETKAEPILKIYSSL